MAPLDGDGVGRSEVRRIRRRHAGAIAARSALIWAGCTAELISDPKFLSPVRSGTESLAAIRESCADRVETKADATPGACPAQRFSTCEYRRHLGDTGAT
jgi:hypothetical protein